MKLTRTVLYLFFLTTLVQCAKPGTPTGGAKDSIPPRLVNASPKMKTTEFDKTEIRLNFDWLNQISNKQSTVNQKI